ncbi:type II toxin-antitoxin system Phd/YefM family antitoxin [Microbacterium protaetiae]|uniref:Antitoxin n=1 Tax=Microbacterium protaetiae TaxID=2509458 RepID=A0A4P6EGB8_9MICO|nr:type II toxin-antitoxin system prevent-host-death family antitoxin [Microbacterium protaetiae]QAY61480.1 type II toxin-antitoxin system Phd/YefM family antitoxin [Microbacterium protaetiae]
MAEVPVRELRNDTAGVLRRAQAGEDIVITVHGNPAVRLIPAAPERRRVIPREELFAWLLKHQADPGLRDELRELAGEMTDEADIV